MKDALQYLRDTIAQNGAALSAFVVVTWVLLFVPQITNIWWSLPFSYAGGEAQAMGFALLVPAFPWFYFAAWMALVKVRGQDSLLLVGIVCVLATGLVAYRFGLPSWNDSGPELWRKISTITVVVMTGVAFFATWGEHLRPDVAWTRVILGYAALPFFWLARLLGEPGKPASESWPIVKLRTLLDKPLSYLELFFQTVSGLNTLMLLAHGVVVGSWVEGVNKLHQRRRTKLLGRLALSFCSAGLVGLGLWSLYTRGWFRFVPGLYAETLVGMSACPALIVGVWLAAVTAWSRRVPHVPPEGPTPPGPVKPFPPQPLAQSLRLTGQAAILVLVGAGMGSTIWLLSELAPALCSYRLYTIWAAFYIGFVVIAVATSVDALHYAIPWLPVRQFALAVAVPLPFVFHWSANLAPDAPAEPGLVKAKVPDWYEACWARMEHVEKQGGAGPYVIVAASGGGSRASLFAGLVLDRLGREQFPGGKPGTAWNDRVLFVSSVSGGSLASAYHSFTPGSVGTQVEATRNSFDGELRRRTADQFVAVKDFYLPADRPGRLTELQEAFDKQVHGAAGKDAALKEAADKLKADFLADDDLRWVLSSRFGDDMCTDFMAPILRAILMPELERGRSLSRFWEEMFAWRPAEGDNDNFRHDPARPLLLFNTTEVRYGHRVVLGFPQLPRRAFTLHLAGTPFDPKAPRTQSLADFRPGQRVRLPDAVRASASFPWGVQSGYFSYPARKYDFTDEKARRTFKDVLAPFRAALGKLLPPELKLERELRWLDADQAAIAQNSRAAVDGLNRVVREVELLREDPHVHVGARKAASAVLSALEPFRGAAAWESRELVLMDGGINDNTGIASAVEVLQALDAAAYGDDPLLAKSCKDRARQIVERLRERGLVLIEIDSGAKGSAAEVHELKRPLQAMDNAAVATALENRERYLDRLQALAAPRGVWSPGAGGLRWAATHVFHCNHRDPGDVMTCWALGPDDKARVLATFYCEYQMWKQDAMDPAAPTSVARWIAGHHAEVDRARRMRERPAEVMLENVVQSVAPAWLPGVPAKAAPPAAGGLRRYSDAARARDERRATQQVEILRNQKQQRE